MGTVIIEKASKKDIELLYECVRIAHEAKEKGNHPFGALLADKNGNILTVQGNTFTEGGSAAHAETLLSLKAAKQYSPEFLASCSLYTNFEPCVMCTGCMYWSNILRLVYGASERMLLSLTGDNPENPTFSLSAVDVIKAGQKTMTVVGPVEDPDLIEAILSDHRGFWN